MKRYAFSRRTRFRFVEQDGSDAGDFEIERRTPNGHVIATSLELVADKEAVEEGSAGARLSAPGAGCGHVGPDGVGSHGETADSRRDDSELVRLCLHERPAYFA